MTEERFPYTGKSLHWQGQRWNFVASEESAATGVEGKVKRNLHRGSELNSTCQPEMLVCSPTGASGGWVLKLGLWRSDHGKKSGVGCMKTA